VDKNRERIERATRKSERAGVDIHWLNFSVEDVLANFPQGREVEEFFILFPDPWPKERHHKHRFINALSLAAMAKIATPNARLTFRSDNDGYCDEVRVLLAESKQWERVEAAFPQGLPETVFEQYHPQFGTLCARRR
jgi:tRNA (guanine-N7-)-methyltransferase